MDGKAIYSEVTWSDLGATFLLWTSKKQKKSGDEFRAIKKRKGKIHKYFTENNTFLWQPNFKRIVKFIQWKTKNRWGKKNDSSNFQKKQLLNIL